MNFPTLKKWLFICVLLVGVFGLGGCGENIDNDLRVRKVKGAVESALSPGYGTCGRCGRPWNRVEEHTTWFQEDPSEPSSKNDSDLTIFVLDMGCFPLCEECWGELTPKERLPYYRELFNEWTLEAIRDGYEAPPKKQWESIRAAVLAGK